MLFFTFIFYDGMKNWIKEKVFFSLQINFIYLFIYFTSSHWINFQWQLAMDVLNINIRKIEKIIEKIVNRLFRFIRLIWISKSLYLMLPFSSLNLISSNKKKNIELFIISWRIKKLSMRGITAALLIFSNNL